MRRLLLLVALLLLLPTAARAASGTRVTRVSPLTASGELRSGLRIADRAKGSCVPGSEAVPGTCPPVGRRVTPARPAVWPPVVRPVFPNEGLPVAISWFFARDDREFGPFTVGLVTGLRDEVQIAGATAA